MTFGPKYIGYERMDPGGERLSRIPARPNLSALAFQDDSGSLCNDHWTSAVNLF